MKKTVLSITAVILFSIGAIAQTPIAMPWNQYSGDDPNYKYQGKDGSKFAGITLQENDVVTLTIAGTADDDISEFQVVIVDDREVVGYWNELSNWQELGSTGNVSANVPFEFTVSLVVSEDAAGAGATFQKLVFDGVNSVLAGGNGAGTSISLNLTTFEMSIFSPIPGAVVLSGNDRKQAARTLLPEETTVEAGDVVRVTIEGISDVDFSDLQVVLVDESADAEEQYWTELSEWITTEQTAFNAGEEFTLTFDIPVTKAPIGTTKNNQNIVISAETEADVIQLSLDVFTAVIVDEDEDETPTNLSTIEASSVNVFPIPAVSTLTIASEATVSSVTVSAINGSVVLVENSGSNQINVASLPKGVYVASITFDNGAVVEKQFVK